MGFGFVWWWWWWWQWAMVLVVVVDVVVVEVVVVETVDVVQVWFFQIFRRGCLGDMMGVRAAVEVVVGVVTEIHIWVKVWVGVWEGVMAWMVYRLAAFCRVDSKVLMPLLGCEGVFSLQLRWRLNWGAWMPLKWGRVGQTWMCAG